jgi:glycosyltransferase involved in cell wall biosynthesis
MRSPLHVVQISFFRDPEERLPSQLLHAWPSLMDVAEAARAGGTHVTVVQASSHSEFLVWGGVHYHFLPFDATERPGQGNGEESARSAGRAERSPAGIAALLARLAPDVLHVHGLGFARDVLSLASLAPGIPIILQDHADRLPRLWRRGPCRLQMSLAAGVAFCARAQARPFTDAGLLSPGTPVYEIPESTSRFAPGELCEAREITGLQGNPAVLWVGHLNDNKDPLTVLDGVSRAAQELPALRLWCCFGSASLLAIVQRRIAEDARLRSRVRLIGRVAHETIEQLMRAADLFVVGSHHEGSGYSLIEALACGLPPIVTDIPSFRSLTAGGAVGALWPCGDSQALCEAMVTARFDGETRAAVRAHFDRELSLHALGRKLAAMYVDAHRRTCRQHVSAMGRS